MKKLIGILKMLSPVILLMLAGAIPLTHEGIDHTNCYWECMFQYNRSWQVIVSMMLYLLAGLSVYFIWVPKRKKK